MIPMIFNSAIDHSSLKIKMFGSLSRLHFPSDNNHQPFITGKEIKHGTILGRGIYQIIPSQEDNNRG